MLNEYLIVYVDLNRVDKVTRVTAHSMLSAMEILKSEVGLVWAMISITIIPEV
jgi:hypothetical protein